MNTQRFNPLNYGFNWTGDWYDFDHTAAHTAAKAARDAEVKRLRKAGQKVRCGYSKGQLMSRGGIGSGHPHIELIVTVYTLVQS